VKFVFLDIDGVLNDIELHRMMEWGGKKWGWDWVRPLLVKKLNTIIERTGALVVVSSSWRQKWTKQELQTILDEQGFVGEVASVTPVLEDPRFYAERGPVFPDRSDEVLEWIGLCKHASPGIDIRYVVLDDRGEFFQNTPGINIVLTDGDVGLTDEDVERAVEILNE